MIRKMMELARKWHAGQFRNAPDGEIPPPYIVHPEAVARNLLDWGEPENSESVSSMIPRDMRPKMAERPSRVLIIVPTDGRVSVRSR